MTQDTTAPGADRHDGATQTVFITGATRGVGLALVERAVSDGWRVIATARRPDQADKLRLLADLTTRVEILGLDVGDEASLAAAADALSGRPVDLAVANAGVFIGRGGLDDPALDMAAWRDVLMTNVWGVFATARLILPSLRGASEPKFVVISSQMGSSSRAPGGSYAYRASKAAATNLARNLAGELRRDGVAVGAYHPGWVRTDMGGDGADISPRESAAGLMRRFTALSLASTGVVEDYAGKPVSY